MSRTRALILEGASAGPWALGSLARELAPVTNQPLVRHQLVALRAAGIREVALVGGRELVEAIRAGFGDGVELGLELSYIAIAAGTPAPAAMLAAEEFVAGRPFVVQPGATLVEHDLRQSVAALVGRRLHGIVVQAALTESAVQIRPDPAAATGSAATAVVDTQLQPSLFVFDPAVFDVIHEALAGEGEPGMREILRMLDSRRGGVEVHCVSGWSTRIDGIDDLLEANRRALDRLPKQYGGRRVNGALVRGPTAIDDEATIESSSLQGPVAIAAGAYVADSYIGPYSCIGASAAVEGVEMESCVILPRASLSHVGARLEECVVGENARIARAFTLPRVLRVWVGKEARVWLV